MGKFDTLTKKYMSNPDIFADAFNYLLYDGKRVISSDTLQSVDTTEIAVPYGADEKSKAPVQKYRDNLKLWAAMHDNNAVYVLLGCENQKKLHYAMPVRNLLYDGINYASQIEQSSKSYKSIKINENGIHIRLSSEEFLSGFRKGDKLIPVITAVILFNKDEWDAPKSLYEMLNIPDNLKKFIPDYRINLISPAEIQDYEFSTRGFQGKFSTGFGTLMQIIKHQDEMSVTDIIRNAPIVDSESADMIEEFSNVKFERTTDEEGGINMCKGMEDYLTMIKVETAIESFRSINCPEEEIPERVSKLLDVTIDYVKEMMTPKAV